MANKRASGLVAVVVNGSYAVGGNGGVNDFDITDQLTKYRFYGPITLQLVVARTAGSSTTDVALLCSLDGGTTYSSLLAFTQISAETGDEIKQITVPSGAKVKTDIDLGSGTTSTIKLYVSGAVSGGSGK